jgi:adenylosuccinate lyase
MANVSTSIEKVLQEIRNLQRSEIAEVGEFFDKEKQVGSSTMAHKRNPITAENACGLARIVRSMIIPSYENALLWHERDLANSSAERFTLSHSMILLDDIIIKCDRVLSKLGVDAERMRYNIDAQKGLVMAEKLMIALVDNGMARDVAHEVLRSASMEALESGENLENVCARLVEISEIFTRQELGDLFKPESHLGFSGEIVDEAIRLARDRI